MTMASYDGNKPERSSQARLQRAFLRRSVRINVRKRHELKRFFSSAIRVFEKTRVRPGPSRGWPDQERNEILQSLHSDELQRVRLARELHDEVGQHVLLALLRLRSLKSNILTKEGLNRLKYVEDQIKCIAEKVSSVALELRPPFVEDVPLSRLLPSQLDEWSQGSSITDVVFNCNDPGFDLLPIEVRTALYRIIQEAFSNILKHAAGATEVSITVGRVDGVLNLTVMDNGAGFDPGRDRRTSQIRGSGLGLLGIQERLSFFGGDMTIESSPGSGCALHVRLPVPQERVN